MNGQMGFGDDVPMETRPCPITGVHDAHVVGGTVPFRCPGVVLTGLAAGRKLRDTGIARVTNAANDEWKRAAWTALLKARESLSELTSDDLWPLIPDGVTTTDNRAMGAVFQRAAREKLLVATDRTRPSNRPETHANPKRIWRRVP